VEFCQQLDAEGILADAGATFGECVNFFKGPAIPQATNQIAALCGIDGITAAFGGNKDQCIQVLRTFFQP